MPRILAIDYGKKRCGLAVSDPLQIIATGLETVDTKHVFSYIENYLKNEVVEQLVVGWPKNLNNSPADSASMVQQFINTLKRKFPAIPLTLIDERFTSKIAFQSMIDGGLKKKARQDKAMVDKISAVIILQSFMEMNKK